MKQWNVVSVIALLVVSLSMKITCKRVFKGRNLNKIMGRAGQAKVFGKQVIENPFVRYQDMPQHTRTPIPRFQYDNYEEISPSTTPTTMRTRKYCVTIGNTLRARHKSCFLRPDTGPCRADLVQWYYDVRESKCFRFFWGGCQGNGNKFRSLEECTNYCYMNASMGREKRPHFCKLPFDFGSCFGHYYRWYYDIFGTTCKRRLYSGCGGNQNNFQSYHECFATCVAIPDDTIKDSAIPRTTCFPL